MMEQEKMIIRIGKNTLSFTTFDTSNKECPLIYKPYIIKGSISMAANLREAFKTTPPRNERLQVLIDTPSMLMPIEQFEEENMEVLFNHAFPTSPTKRVVLFNVLPDLKSVCLFAIDKDLHGVLTDRFSQVQFIQAMTPVWHHLHQRSFTGHRNKLYGYFHGRQLDLFGFQQNRFKFSNSFEVTNAHDALYFLLYVWKQLHLEPEHDEMHIVGDIPENEWLLQELRRFLKKAYVINPSADFHDVPATKIKGMPYDLLTLVVKGR